MQISARRYRNRFAYPLTCRAVGRAPFIGKFEDVEIKDPAGFELPIQLRPDGVRQPQVEASILGNIRVIVQGRAGFPDADIRNGAYK